VNVSSSRIHTKNAALRMTGQRIASTGAASGISEATARLFMAERGIALLDPWSTTGRVVRYFRRPAV
jgi:hypothetical protein